MAEVNDIEQMKQMVAARVAEEGTDSADQPAAPPAPEDIDRAIIEKCLEGNERGDGILYSHLLYNQLKYNNVFEQWMCWTGHQWQLDEMEEHHAAVEKVALCYASLLPDIEESLKAALAQEETALASYLKNKRKKILGRIDKLRSDRGVTNCVKMARHVKDNHGNWIMAIGGNEIDQQPLLLSCPNGVVDLRNGKLRPGRQSDYLMRTCNVPYQGLDAPEPENFNRFMEQIQPGHPDRVDYLMRVFAYALTGLDWEHDFYCLYGSRGRNGKSTLMEIMAYILGPLAGSIPASLVMENHFAQNSSGPRPELVKLRGLRLAWASEVDRRQRFSAGALKNMTGGDTISARTLNSGKYHEFTPTHTLFLLTNDKPRVYGDDEAFWARFKLIEFPVHFVKDRKPDPTRLECKADPQLKSKLYEEAPLILSKLMRKLMEYHNIGLAPPASVIDKTREYQEDEDILLKWIKDRCDTSDPQTWSLGKELYADFSKWIVEEGYGDRAWGRNTFNESLRRKFSFKRKGQGNGFYGIRVEFHA